MTPYYRKHGKILKPLTNEEFAEKMEHGQFVRDEHRAYPVCVYYSAVRRLEAWRAMDDQFTVTEDRCYFDVGPRLKKIRRFRRGKRISEKRFQQILKKRRAQITTPPLPLPIDAPYMDELLKAIDRAPDHEGRVFPFSLRTTWNIMDRAFDAYSHYLRLSRITWFFMPHPEIGRPRGFSIPEVKTFTGLSLQALDYYIGLADMTDMGRAMYFERRAAGEQ